MSEQSPDRTISDLMAAHLLALSKATAVYQAELAKAFLQIEDEEGSEAAGTMYKTVRELEKVGLASSMFDQSPKGTSHRARSWNGASAALMESWLDLMHDPLRAYTRALTSFQPTKSG